MFKKALVAAAILAIPAAAAAHHAGSRRNAHRDRAGHGERAG